MRLATATLKLSLTSSRTRKIPDARQGERLLRQAGVKLDQPETFCAYGLAEIKKNSAIGVLLRAK